MSERLRQGNESVQNFEDLEKYEQRIEKKHEANAKNAKHEHQEKLDKILKTIEREAKNTHEIRIEKDDKQQLPSSAVASDLRRQTLKKNLGKIQRELTPKEKKFSVFIHNPTVEALSDIASNTVARPSALFLGGSFALLASLFVSAICYFYGYEYNYLIGMSSFVVGFIFGLFFEFLYKFLKR